MAEQGYILIDPGGVANYTFCNQEHTKTIAFDLDKYMKRWIRVHFQIFFPLERDMLSFNLEYLKPELFPKINVVYETQEELDATLILLTDKIIEIIIPFMDVIQKNAVFQTLEMHEELAKGTIERAERFAEKWDLPLSTEPDMLHLDRVMDGLRKDVSQRKNDFYRNQGEIIDMAAYLGELMNIQENVPHQWYWRKLSDSDSERFYATKAQGFDVLSRVIAAWNLGVEVMNYSFRYFPVR
jgi:hypothetical protein